MSSCYERALGTIYRPDAKLGPGFVSLVLRSLLAPSLVSHFGVTKYIKDVIMVITWPSYKLLTTYKVTIRFCTSSLPCTIGLKRFKFRIKKRLTYGADKFEGQWYTRREHNKKMYKIYILLMNFIWSFNFVWYNTLTFYPVYIMPL